MNSQFESFITFDDNKIKEKIIEKFIDARKERIKILGNEQSKEIEKEFFTIN